MNGIVLGGSDGQGGFGIAVDSLDNIYITGGTGGIVVGETDMFLVKYDRNGVEQWNRTWNGIGDEEDEGYGVAVDDSDNIYVAGTTDGLYQSLLVKYDSSGGELWNYTWGGGGISQNFAEDVAIDSSNEVYVVGYTHEYMETAIVLTKFDSSGNMLWNRTWIGGYNETFGAGVVVDSSDDVYITGGAYSYSLDEANMILLKYNKSGFLQWNRTWGRNNQFEESAFGLALDSMDNIYITGGISPMDSPFYDLFLVKYDNSGTLQWSRTWGGSNDDAGSKVEIDGLDNVYIIGSTDSFGAGNNDILLMQYNSNGLFQSYHTWGGSELEIGYGIIINSLNEVFLSGTTASYGAGGTDMVLVKYGLDIYDPIVTINSPAPNEKFGNTAPSYNISITEPNLESMWYTIDNGITNYTITQQTGTINETAWDASSYGSVTIEFWAKDLDGNIGNNEVLVEKVEKEPTIIGYPLLLVVSILGVVTVIYVIKKNKS